MYIEASASAMEYINRAPREEIMEVRCEHGIYIYSVVMGEDI